MRLDPDLLREILTFLVERPEASFRGDLAPHFPGHDAEKVRGHVGHLTISGHLRALDVRSHDDPYGVIYTPTHRGQEFYELSRDDDRWEAAKADVLSLTGTQDISLIQAMLLSRAKAILGID